MKTICRTGLLIFFITTGTVLFGESNSLVGIWDFETVFSADSLRFEFTRDGTYIVEEADGSTEAWEYFVREDVSTVSLQMDESMIMDWRFSFDGQNDDILYLYIGRENDWFIEQFTRNLFMNEDEQAGELTRNFYSKITEAIENVFFNEPFMKGRKIQ
jgi:hypothetical protein